MIVEYAQRFHRISRVLEFNKGKSKAENKSILELIDFIPLVLFLRIIASHKMARNGFRSSLSNFHFDVSIRSFAGEQVNIFLTVALRNIVDHFFRVKKN